MAKIIELVTNAGQVDVTKGIVEEVLKSVPELDFFDAGTVKGIVMSTLSRTSLPTVAFRKIGDPVSSSRSGFAKRTVELALLSGRVEISEAEAMANGLMSVEEQEADEAISVLRAAFKHIAKQIWYGTSSDAKGFDGAVKLVDAALVTLAGVGTSNANTSVWAVGNGFKTKCGLAFSENSKILSSTDVEFVKKDILVKDPQNNNAVIGVEPGYVGDLTSWAGLHVANKNALARLCNVTTTTGLNDDMLRDLVEAYSIANDGALPDAIFMSFNARKMLRKSREFALKLKGGGDGKVFAPIPTDVDGVKIIATNAIVDTEETVSSDDDDSSSSSSASASASSH